MEEARPFLLSSYLGPVPSVLHFPLSVGQVCTVYVRLYSQAAGEGCTHG
jgi:hypothetical protein